MTTDSESLEISRLVRRYCDACSLADDLQTEMHKWKAADDGHELYLAIQTVMVDRDALKAKLEAAEKRCEELEAAVLDSWKNFDSDDDLTCTHCFELSVTTDSFKHKPDCIVLTLRSRPI